MDLCGSFNCYHRRDRHLGPEAAKPGDEGACLDCLYCRGFVDDPGMRGEELDGYNMTPRNPDGTVAVP